MIFEVRIMREERSFEYMQRIRITSSRWIWDLAEDDMNWGTACFILTAITKFYPGKYKMFDFAGG